MELHWRVHWYERSFAHERLLPPTPDDPPQNWRPAPADELAALLLFYAGMGSSTCASPPTWAPGGTLTAPA